MLLLLFAVGYAAIQPTTNQHRRVLQLCREGSRAARRQCYGICRACRLQRDGDRAERGVPFFANSSFKDVLHIDLPWQAWWGIGVVIVAILSDRQITLTARGVSVALICEIGILLGFDVSVLTDKRSAASRCGCSHRARSSRARRASESCTRSPRSSVFLRISVDR